MEGELKACPFCGGPAKNDGTDSRIGQFWVECTKPGCRGMGPNCRSDEVAANAWNTRPLPASAIQAARVEGAEAAIDTAIRAGACWCKDKKAEAARIVSARWPSTVEQKEEKT